MSERTELQAEIPSIIEKRGPFNVTGREVKHDRFGMQLFGDKVIRPDGSQGEFFWVNFNKEAVLIFPIDDEGNIYLTEEFTYAANKFSTEVAGGSIDPGEDAYEAAKREVKEELGIEADNLGYLGTVQEITSRVNNVTHMFSARVKSVGEAKPESGEIIRLKKVPFQEAFQMAIDGRISTGTVKSGIFQIYIFLEALSKNSNSSSF